jgi:hypothetical protein
MKLTLRDMLFGCWHSRYTFPRTVRDPQQLRKIPAAKLTGTYVVCLTCGKEFPFSAEHWAVITGVEKQVSTLHTKFLTEV